ncbi:NAD(P)/FAD-dependent oxidoreductase [Nocardia sp. alder85J]|uniref:NAD(P)/FAD-dependent oxidoreductase n=1 Tax=Nocardia sp. alder85J TaxID=2862949 RepID=UPI001CD781CA|nr:FAD-dependent oxidoreductase [Nocardia sp. alder85J]MCX4096838.1 FAD-dependent oxidoreductase [Nocardia sp. alder85J]
MTHRIVVLGAGYAGASAAGRLARRLHRDDVEITLVNADPEFVERVRLHQLAGGQDLRSRPLRDICAGTGVVSRQAWVTAIDADRGTVELADAEALGYDTLVYALGSVAVDHVPGDHDVAGKASALRLRERLRESLPGTTVLIVGGGLTGIETATEIAEARPDLRVVLTARGRVGDRLSDKARRHLGAALDRLGVAVHEYTEITGTNRSIPADITVWTTGFTVHPFAAAGTVTVSDTGRIVVDGTMRSISHPDVYAVGDAALAEGAGGAPLRMSCASGIPMAWLAADAIAARLTGRPVPSTTIGYTVQCISLGRRDAIIQRVTAADEVTETTVTGRTAAHIKEFICAGAAWSVAHPTLMLPTRRRRVVVDRNHATVG